MMHSIKPGDTVNIFWERIQSIFNAVVIYVPNKNGESYIVEGKHGQTIYIKDFCVMEKVK